MRIENVISPIKTTAKEVAKRVGLVLSWQNNEPLTQECLFLIHTDRYNKPYRDDIEESLNKYKQLIIELVEQQKLNPSNILRRDNMINLINLYLLHKTSNEYVSRIVEHEYILSLEDLVEENENIYNICLQALTHYNELIDENTKDFKQCLHSLLKD